MVFHMLHENQSFKSMTCLTSILKNVFNEKKFSCGRTKAAAIVNNVFQPMITETIESELEKVRFMGRFITFLPNQ